MRHHTEHGNNIYHIMYDIIQKSTDTIIYDILCFMVVRSIAFILTGNKGFVLK